MQPPFVCIYGASNRAFLPATNQRYVRLRRQAALLDQPELLFKHEILVALASNLDLSILGLDRLLDLHFFNSLSCFIDFVLNRLQLSLFDSMLFFHFPGMYGLAVGRLHALFRGVLRASPLRCPLCDFLLLPLLGMHDGALDALGQRVLLHHLVMAVLGVTATISAFSHFEFLLVKLLLKGSLLI